MKKINKKYKSNKAVQKCECVLAMIQNKFGHSLQQQTLSLQNEAKVYQKDAAEAIISFSKLSFTWI